MRISSILDGNHFTNALLFESSPEVPEKGLPKWIERTSTVLPSESAFLTGADRTVDSDSYALLEENLDLPPDQCLGVRMFRSRLLSMVPLIAKAGAVVEPSTQSRWE